MIVNIVTMANKVNCTSSHRTKRISPFDDQISVVC